MIRENYNNQIRLLLNVLPEVAKESCFAIHGGTAINLFVLDMPRISVDIDLTYVPIEERDITFKNIYVALERIKGNIEEIIPKVQIEHLVKKLKLLITVKGVQIKIEVNQIKRGALASPEILTLCEKAQINFDSFCAIQVVPFGQLYGGKICAAMDRQHPRDLFDVKYLLKNETFTLKLKTGFLLSLLGSNRPIEEVLYPNLTDQQSAMSNQFEGMSAERFSYNDFELTREKLIHIVQTSLTEQDKEFLLGFKNAMPIWDIYDFAKFPSVQYKLENLEILKNSYPKKHQAQYDALKEKLRCAEK